MATIMMSMHLLDVVVVAVWSLCALVIAGLLIGGVKKDSDDWY